MKHSKRFFLFITLDIFLLFLSSCGMPACNTEIRVINSSSYDLIIDFEIDQREYTQVELEKNHSTSFVLTNDYVYVGEFTNPNEVMSRMVLSNLDNGEIIKELINDLNENEILFILERGWAKRDNRIEAQFLLEITDALLGFTNE